MALSAAALLSRGQTPLVFAAFWVAGAAGGTVYALWFAFRIKVVSLDSQFLYVSDRGREVAVPLGQITGVRESMLGQPKQVIIELKGPAGPAREIVFIPRKAHGFRAVVSDPIVDELRLHIAPEPSKGRDREHLGFRHGRHP